MPPPGRCRQLTGAAAAGPGAKARASTLAAPKAATGPGRGSTEEPARWRGTSPGRWGCSRAGSGDAGGQGRRGRESSKCRLQLYVLGCAGSGRLLTLDPTDPPASVLELRPPSQQVQQWPAAEAPGRNALMQAQSSMQGGVGGTPTEPTCTPARTASSPGALPARPPRPTPAPGCTAGCGSGGRGGRWVVGRWAVGAWP